MKRNPKTKILVEDNAPVIRCRAIRRRRMNGSDDAKTRGMWGAMLAEGYKENTKTLTRAQVRTIVRFLGEP